MATYDVRIKTFLRHGAREMLAAMAFNDPLSPIDTDVSYLRGPRVDYLARTPSGKLVHIEFQKAGDKSMPLRMLEYYTHILRAQDDWAEVDYQRTANAIELRQAVLYFDRIPRRSPRLVESNRLFFQYDAHSMRGLPEEAMLGSVDVGDVVLSFLCVSEAGIRERVIAIVARLDELLSTESIDQSVHEYALGCLVVLGSAREVPEMVTDEVARLKLDIDFDKNEIVVEYHERKAKRELLGYIEEAVIENEGEGLTEAQQEQLLALSTRQMAAVLRRIDTGLRNALDDAEPKPPTRPFGTI